MKKKSKFRWKCPKCGAKANKHGKGPCKLSSSDCEGLICECDGDVGNSHGVTLSDPCSNANCYHCGWFGFLPYIVKISKDWPKWARLAMKNGWLPPENWEPGAIAVPHDKKPAKTDS